MVQVAYDPAKYIAVVDGVPVVDPADAEDAFMATYNEDRVTVVKGMYGRGGFEINRATDAGFTIKTKGKSPDNARFAQIDKLKRQVRLAFINKNSNEEVASTRAAMVQTHPGVSGGTAQQDKTWVFGAGEADLFPGGNKTDPTV